MPVRLGIVLAGGRGRRMHADVPKALLPLAGRTLLARACAQLQVLCDDVVVCAPADLALPVDDAVRVHDAADATGPLAGLVAGLAARNFDFAAALGVDLPLLQRGMLDALLGRIGPHAVVIPAPGGVPQPLAAWYAAAALAPLAAALARGERALTPAVLALPHVLVGDDVLRTLPGGLDSFLNVNTPAQLIEAGERLAAAGIA